MKIEELRMLDVSNPLAVEVELSSDERTLWINIGGVCFLRAQLAPTSRRDVLDVTLKGFHESHLG